MHEVFCGYRKSESHDQNDETNKPLTLYGTISEGHVQKISHTSWSNCEHFTLMLFIATVLR